MDKPATMTATVCLVALFLLLVIELLIRRRLKNFGTGCLFLLIVIAILHVLTGYPAPKNSVAETAFGPTRDGLSTYVSITLVFVSSMLGIVARYAFFLRDKFNWGGILRPLCITPLVMLPTIGLFQQGEELHGLQILSLSLLAFQNGFFWKAVLEKIRV